MWSLKSLFGTSVKDEARRAVGVSGDWEGVYRQRERVVPIRVALVQDGQRVHGTMRDLETEFEGSLFDACLNAGLPPGADEQLDARLREMYPHARNQPIRTASRLPAESVVEGTVDGSVIRFVKTYQGQCFSGYRIGEQLVGSTNENHAVQYDGKIDAAGNTIEGRWTIQSREYPQQLFQGTFLLKRAGRTKRG